MNGNGDWYLLAGILLLAQLFGDAILARWPVTPAMIYLGLGYLLGPAVGNVVRLDLVRDAPLIERFAEIAVLVSLFTSGLKLRAPWSDPRWRQPVGLATVSMVATVALVAVLATQALHLSLGAAILLGAILAPTDPVLASAVQLRDPHDRDRLRFSLTGEAGMNDGTAFPLVVLGLGFLGLGPSLHDGAWHWVATEVLWKCAAGIAVGTFCGRGIAYLVLKMRVQRRETVGLDDLVAMGLIAFAYGLAEMIHGLGFLAVFFAGVAFRATERQHSGDLPVDKLKAAAAAPAEVAATHHRAAPAHMAGAVLDINEHLERICQLGVVLLTGTLLSTHYHPAVLWFAPALFLVIRPLAVLPASLCSRLPFRDQALVSWFGIRGIGSIYYLAYAIHRGLAGDERETMIALTLSTVTASIFLHGFSITGLMERRDARRRESALG